MADKNDGTGTWKYLVNASIVVILTLISFPAHSRDDGRYANSPLKLWFESLKQPQTGASCCSLSDCLRTEQEMAGDHYRAMLDGRWVDIPNEIVITTEGNPLGEPLLCADRHSNGRLYCFVPGGGM